ncbi:MAG: PKD domain-containing protein [Candidatus Bipolaricaulota bacterium]|nr:MAG: PKD domain-containing protein [Candidatus Bipolaricaulota bacterium]
MRRTATLAMAAALLAGAAGCALVGIGPTARFDVSPVVLYSGELLVFDGGSSLSLSSIVSFDWSYGDGETGVGQRTEHRYELPGLYEVSLRVVDANGNEDRATRTLSVYARSGTELLREDFDGGPSTLDGWALDASWASERDGAVEFIGGEHAYALRIRSDEDRWHRRWRSVELPPLRIGQRFAFECDVMTAQTKYDAGFFIFPLRASLDTVEGSLPYVEYSSETEGVATVAVSPFGTLMRQPTTFSPGIYRWHRYRLEIAPGRYELFIDGTLRASGEQGIPAQLAGPWLTVLGDESHELRCDAFFDNISLTVVE